MKKEKIRIGIDIDDTICNSYEMSYACVRHNYKRRGKLGPNKNIKRDLSGYFREEGSDRFDRILKQYHMDHNSMYPKVFVKEVTRILKKYGFEIYIITARMNFLWKGSVAKYLKKWLKTFGIKFDKIIANRTDKENVCVENNITYMIDDSISNISKINEKGIKTIMFNTFYNKDYSHELNTRADTWLDIYDVFKDAYNIDEEIISFE